jgi:hypothetical protein
VLQAVGRLAYGFVRGIAPRSARRKARVIASGIARECVPEVIRRVVRGVVVPAVPWGKPQAPSANTQPRPNHQVGLPFWPLTIEVWGLSGILGWDVGRSRGGLLNCSRPAV